MPVKPSKINVSELPAIIAGVCHQRIVEIVCNVKIRKVSIGDELYSVTADESENALKQHKR